MLTIRFNITKGNKHEKEMSTGLHIVSDVYCAGCEQYIGWGYDYAYSHTEKYKEDCFILEKAFFEEIRMETNRTEENG